MAAPGLGFECSGVRDRGSGCCGRLLGKPVTTRGPRSTGVDLGPGDALLLCTEGLTRHLPNPALADELAVPCPLGRGAGILKRLVARAREAGASGDVTVVLARTRAARGRRRQPRSRS